ncbi:TPA: hypothetical protein N0F65_010109 [Lagenidium giganteum]|uniref:TOG domain-containing protein n=1 Tax=Lagenidium giganteum TaxID=4803 RepID=A0AAV2YAW7_9STRA|nr:TPA: hypothetical protein N0F65_010109 [Lagenidium giganteum]
MSKLRFTVLSCSGEDPGFPARELNEHASTSKGYMTPKSCEYPQELILKLMDGLCRVTQVQILSHQSHIASKIELFLGKGSSLQDAAFQRLGYLTLKSNVESNYMARELKTVHIDNEAVFIKLVLHQCYVNERNLYCQVGIMAINLCGEPLELMSGELPSQSAGELMSSVAARSIPKPAPASSATDDLAFDLRFDAKTAERIREIHIAKEKAVAMEDYDQAKRLKQMEEQLKSIGLQLARLETQKREAVANEDYDLAKRVKDEIAMLEASVGSNETQPIMASQSASSGGSYAHSPTFTNNGHGSQAKKAVARSQVLPRAGAAAIAGTKAVVNSSSSSNFSPRDMYTDDRMGMKKEPFDEETPVGKGSRAMASQPQDDSEPASPNGMRGSGANPNFRGIPDAEDLPDPEPMPPALEKESEEMIEVIGQFFTRCFYSNLWNHRDAAIRKVTMELNNYRADPISVLQVCATMVQSGAGDRIAQVSLSAFRLLDKLLPYASGVRQADMSRILANSATQLVNKLGEAQTKVRDEAAAALMRLASTRNVGVAFVATHLTKRSKKPLGLKLLQGRLVVIKDLLARFELIPDSDYSAAGLMSFMEDSACFAHQSREIRDIAKEISVAVYLIVGAEVEDYLKSLRPKQLEEYQAAFEAAEAGPAQNARSGSQNHARAEAKPAANGRNSRGIPTDDTNGDVDDDDESVDEYTCPFCGVVDENFDSDRLDQHFWADCRLLTPCKMCGQVIEIASLNEHLLTECELKKNHRECPRCGEAITAKFYEKHISLNDCLPRPHPKKANRCPLCHEDIAPGKKGWKYHLSDETCPNNPRS